MAVAIGELADEIRDLPRHWWVVALRGLAAVIFGILALFWPGITLGVLVLLFGSYAIVDGILAFYSAVRSSGKQPWAQVLEGIVGVLAGVATFVWPGLTALALLFFIAGWAIITGLLEIATAVRLREVINNEWALILGGVVSVIFGIILAVQPGAGAVALVWLIGVYAIVFGIIMLALSWRLREFQMK
jgi:uncharacterized membrane protein HdeD (DUF308 family)